MGGVKTIIKNLASDEYTGIVGDGKDIKRRTKVFGANSKALPKLPGILTSIILEAKSVIWIVIVVSAILAGICGIFVNGYKKIIEALSIILVAAIIIVITSTADWIKDRKFIQL